MFQNVLLVWRNVAAFASAHAAGVKERGKDVPKKVLTSSSPVWPTAEKPRPDSESRPQPSPSPSVFNSHGTPLRATTLKRRSRASWRQGLPATW
jgi:hypothetical protein